MTDRELLRECVSMMSGYHVTLQGSVELIARITARLSEPEDVAAVPREPTKAMLDAAHQIKRERLLRSVEAIKNGETLDERLGYGLAAEWKAMLDAAQQKGWP